MALAWRTVNSHRILEIVPGAAESIAEIGSIVPQSLIAIATDGHSRFNTLVQVGGAGYIQPVSWGRCPDTNVTAGFVLESPIGPVFAGASFGLDGRYRVYFSLGPIIK